jgi:HEAT repeat protein
MGRRDSSSSRNRVQRDIASVLEGSDRRSIGHADEIAALVLKQPKLSRELIACLWHDDPIVRMRAADAAEKVSLKSPALLQGHKSELLGLLAETEQIELRWHLAQMIPRLKLTAPERQRAVSALQRYLDDRSSIVRTWALNALVQLSQHDETLHSKTRQLLEEALQSGTPAMKARARKLQKNCQG